MKNTWKKRLTGLALVLAMALSLAPTVFAAGQFTDVPDTSPFAAAISWAVEKQITNGTTPTTFGPKNTCTTSHILTFLWRANGRPGDAGDEKAAVTAWANGLGIDTSDLNAPCTRANAVTYMWKAAGSPAPVQTASFTDVAADAPYASAVSWAVEKGVTKGTSDTAFSPYDTCTRGQIVTFLCRQLDPEAAKAQPAAPAQPEAPAPQADTPETVLAQVQGVWHRVYGDDKSSIEEYRIDGSTVYLTMLNRMLTGPEYQYADVPIQLVKSETEENRYDLFIQGSTKPVTHQCSAEIGAIDKDGRWPLSNPNVSVGSVVKDPASGVWIARNQGRQDMTRVSASLRDEEFEAVLKQAQEKTEAVSKYATYAKWPTVPDFGAIFGLPDRTNNEPLEYIPGLDPTIIDQINAMDAWISSKSDITIYTYDRADAGSYEKLLDLENQYVSILKECGFTASMKNTAAGGRGLYYSKGNVSVSLGWNEPHRDWTSSRNPGYRVDPDHLYVSVQSS